MERCIIYDLILGPKTLIQEVHHALEFGDLTWSSHHLWIASGPNYCFKALSYSLHWLCLTRIWLVMVLFACILVHALMAMSSCFFTHKFSFGSIHNHGMVNNIRCIQVIQMLCLQVCLLLYCIVDDCIDSCCGCPIS